MSSDPFLPRAYRDAAGSPAKDVVGQLGALHGSPFALGLAISPLHILSLSRLEVQVGTPRGEPSPARPAPGQEGCEAGCDLCGLGPAEGAGHFIRSLLEGSPALRPPPVLLMVSGRSARWRGCRVRGIDVGQSGLESRADLDSSNLRSGRETRQYVWDGEVGRCRILEILSSLFTNTTAC